MKKIFRIFIYTIISILTLIFLSFGGIYLTNKVLNKQDSERIKNYGERVTVNNERINISITGKSNRKTIVLLPGYATGSPIIDFKPLTDSLSRDFRVVTIGPLGYGLSDDTTSERTLKNISEEIHGVLNKLNIHRYTLMGHSISGIYTLDYMNRYSQEVSTFVGIDTSIPNQGSTDDDPGSSFSFLSKSGIYRLLTNLEPNTLNYPNVSQAEKTNFRRISLKNLDNKTIINESKNMKNNFKGFSLFTSHTIKENN